MAVKVRRMLLIGVVSATAVYTNVSRPRAAAGMESPPVPDGMILDWHHAWEQQLEFLLNLEPVTPAGHFDSPVKHGRIWFALQRPVWSQPCRQHHSLQQARQADCRHDHTRLCGQTPIALARKGVAKEKGP